MSPSRLFHSVIVFYSSKIFIWCFFISSISLLRLSIFHLFQTMSVIDHWCIFMMVVLKPLPRCSSEKQCCVYLTLLRMVSLDPVNNSGWRNVPLSWVQSCPVSTCTMRSPVSRARLLSTLCRTYFLPWNALPSLPYFLLWKPTQDPLSSGHHGPLLLLIQPLPVLPPVLTVPRSVFLRGMVMRRMCLSRGLSVRGKECAQNWTRVTSLHVRKGSTQIQMI